MASAKYRDLRNATAHCATADDYRDAAGTVQLAQQEYAGRRGELAAAWNHSLATGENRMADDCGWRAAETANRFFEGDTLVKMADGSWRKISELRVGDRVLAVPHGSVNEAATACEVTAIESGAASAWQLTFVNSSGETLQFTASEGHPFYVDGRGWVDVKDLEEGDIIVTQNGEVFSLQEKTLVENVRTWSLTVAENHTFFVGDGLGNEVVVHNEGEEKAREVLIDEILNIFQSQGRRPSPAKLKSWQFLPTENLSKLLNEYRQREGIYESERKYYEGKAEYFSENTEEAKEQVRLMFIANAEKNRASARLWKEFASPPKISEDDKFINILLQRASNTTGPISSYVTNIPEGWARIFSGAPDPFRGPCANWCSNFTMATIGIDLFTTPGNSWTNENGNIRITCSGGITNFPWYDPEWIIWPSHYYLVVERGYTDEVGFHPQKTFYIDNGVLGGATGVFFEIPKNYFQ